MLLVQYNMYQLSEAKETDSREKKSTSIYILTESSGHHALLVMDLCHLNCSISGLLKKNNIYLFIENGYRT